MAVVFLFFVLGYPSLSNAAIQKEFDEKKGFKDYIAKKLDTFGVTSEPTTTRLTTSDKTQTIPRRTTPPVRETSVRKTLVRTARGRKI
jgi:uncharacterized membrane protein